MALIKKITFFFNDIRINASITVQFHIQYLTFIEYILCRPIYLAKPTTTTDTYIYRCIHTNTYKDIYFICLFDKTSNNK